MLDFTPLATESSVHLRDSLHAACLLEATARKPGNVHPRASFADSTYEHFRLAASAATPYLARSADVGVGRAVQEAVKATAAVAPGNTNLGIVLLLAPLAAVPAGQSLKEGIGGVLDHLTVTDAEHVYAAIRLARPGGLGRVESQDVARAPTVTLRDVMALAADRDRVAWQYANRFADVLEFGMSWLAHRADFARTWERTVTHLFLESLARHPDSLIARKCGPEFAVDVSRRARELLRAGWPDASRAPRMFDEFDRFLRSDGNRRNPGTTADLVAASLFAALRERLISIPERITLDETHPYPDTRYPKPET